MKKQKLRESYWIVQYLEDYDGFRSIDSFHIGKCPFSGIVEKCKSIGIKEGDILSVKHQGL